MRIRVAVLMGGRSSEREVSLSTGRMVMRALDPERYEVLGVDTGNLGDLTALLAGSPESRPDVAFIALHGRFGEDGTVQGLLDLLGIPYVGSGVLASAVCMNKWLTKRILASEGIPTPAYVVLDGPAAIEEYLDRLQAPGSRLQVPDTDNLELGAWSLEPSGTLSLPVIVKPNEGGSTIGMTVVRTPEELAPALRLAARYDRCILVEALVSGTEITVPILGNDVLQVLPIVEIVPEGGFYDYERKYTPGATDEIVPARISAAAAARAEEYAVRAHRALHCRGMSRVDMFVNGDQVTVLEVNTIPGMTPTSLLPRAAEAAGISFPCLVERLIDLALEGQERGREGDAAEAVAISGSES
jgi:D-alanine-D-alanine ligase